MDFAKLALDEEWLALLEGVARGAGLDLPPKRLAAEVRALSDAYNTGAFTRARTRGALAARLLFSFARDVPKSACAARELAFARRLALPMRVLDVGAGLGASTWGLARLLAMGGARGAIDATFVDDDPGALGLARTISDARRAEGEVEVRVTVQNRAPASGRFDVILLGQSLGEIDADETKQVALIEALAKSLHDHGSLVVIEPALADRTRRLQRVRDALVARGLTVFAPCLHAAPCPMLKDPKSWCHEDLPVDLPPSVAAIARAAGLRRQGLTFSYLVLRKDGVTLRGRVAPGALRVVSSPIVTKGKRELYLCGDARVRKLARLDRDEPKRGGAWSNAARGDVVAFSRPIDDDATRVPGDVDVRLEPTA